MSLDIAVLQMVLSQLDHLLVEIRRTCGVIIISYKIVDKVNK